MTQPEKNIGQYYGDLTVLNTKRLILDSVGKEMLEEIVGSYLDVLRTSSAIYEENGDYAMGIFSSGFCKLLDRSSRKLCNTDDNKEALEGGKWLCHELCWKDCAKAAIDTGQSQDIECNGGIHLYGEPIFAGGKTVGAINFGYGPPSSDPEKIAQIAEKYKISKEELLDEINKFKISSDDAIEAEKNNLKLIAMLIGVLIEKSQIEKESQKHFKEATEFNKVCVDREHRILDLKREVNSLLAQLGKDGKYSIT